MFLIPNFNDLSGRQYADPFDLVGNIIFTEFWIIDPDQGRWIDTGGRFLFPWHPWHFRGAIRGKRNH
jgi:hypothetical protein